MRLQPPLHELDSVELREAVNGWPVGTPGTVVDVPAEGFVTVEVRADRVPDDLSLLDTLLDLPASAVRVIAGMFTARGFEG